MTVFECLNCSTTQAANGRPRKCINGCGGLYLKAMNEPELIEGSDAERVVAMAAAEGEALTAALRSPGRDVSARAGEMERESPLFFGTGDNPLLF